MVCNRLSFISVVVAASLVILCATASRFIAAMNGSEKTSYPHRCINRIDGSTLYLHQTESKVLNGTPESFYYAYAFVTGSQFRRFMRRTGYEISPEAWECRDDSGPAWVTYRDALSYVSWARLRLPTREELRFLETSPLTDPYPWYGFLQQKYSPGASVFHVAASPDQLLRSETNVDDDNLVHGASPQRVTADPTSGITQDSGLARATRS